MGLFELLLAICLLLAAWLFCHILITIDRRIRASFDHDAIYRQNMGEISGADIVWAMKEKEGDK